MRANSFGTGLLVGVVLALALAFTYSYFIRSDDIDVYGVQGVTNDGRAGIRVFAKNPAEGCDGYKLSVSVSEEDDEAVVIKPSLSKLPSTGKCALQLGGGPMSIETTVSLDSKLGQRVVYVDSRDRENFVPKFGSYRDSKD